MLVQIGNVFQSLISITLDLHFNLRTVNKLWQTYELFPDDIHTAFKNKQKHFKIIPGGHVKTLTQE